MLGGPGVAAAGAVRLPDLPDLRGGEAVGARGGVLGRAWPRSWCTIPTPNDCWNVPGTPFAVVMDAAGVVRAKGTVNNLEQIEGLVDTAERRIAEDRSRGRRVDRPVRTDRGGGRAARAADEPPGLPGPAGSRVWSPSPAAASWRRRSPGPGPRPTTSAGTRSPPAPARTRTRRCRAPTGTASRSIPPTGIPSTTRAPCTTTRRRRRRRKICEQIVPDRYGFVSHPRYGGGWTRCCSGRLRHIQDCCSTSDIRINGDAAVRGYCPPPPEGVLHHVPRAHRHVLSGSVLVPLVIASVVAGISTLFGP